MENTDTSTRARLGTALRTLGAREWPLATALGVFAAVHLAWLIYRLPIPLEIFTNEAWNAWHAIAATGARALYPGRDELIVNNYTPLSYYLVGYLGKLIGDVILAGRIVSLFATVAIGALVYGLVRRLGGGRGAAALGAMWWLASIFRSGADYVGANDPTLLALALMVAGFAWCLHLLDAGRTVLPAIAVMVVAGFFKHNLVVLPIVVMMWLASLNVRRAMGAALFGAALSATGLALCSLAYGPDFITQLTLPREIRLFRPLQHLNRLQFLIVPLVVWLLWIARDRKHPAARLTALWIGFGFVSFLLQKLSPGVANNASFEMWVGVAVGFGVAMAHLGRLSLAVIHGVEPVRAVIVAAVFVRLLADPNIEPYRLALPAYRADIAARAALVASEIAAVQAGPKPVACYVMSMCFRAGQPFVYDNFGAGMRTSTGNLTRAEHAAIVARLGLMYRLSDPRVSWERDFPRPSQVGVTVPFPRGS